MTQLIPIKDLHPDPRNANYCSDEVLKKLERNIQRTGHYPPLIVRPMKRKKDQFILIDGHHRLEVLKKLGKVEVECQVWDLPDTEIKMLLLTLNRLRGEDNPMKRAELVESLVKSIPVEDLSQYLPENKFQLDDLLALRNFDVDELEAQIRKEVELQERAMPVPFAFMVPAEDVSAVQEALDHFVDKKKEKDHSTAFINLCKYVMEEKQNV